MVSLQPLSDVNRAAAEALRVTADQQRFVSTVAESLREAAAHPATHAQPWLILADTTPVGFALTVDEVDSPDYLPHFLWKLLIDERHQGQGHGTATLDLLAARVRDRPGAEALTTRVRLGEGSPIGFYERYGFERAGEVVDGEVLLHLRLRKGRRACGRQV